MERIDSLDTLKGLALFAVVIIHIRGSFLTSQGLEDGLFDLTIFSVSRFGVPMFFLISGFLLKKKFKERDENRYTKKYLKKLLSYYLLASGLYLILQSALIVIEANTGITFPRDISMGISLFEGIYDVLYTGTAVRGSLWFFPALAISAGLIYFSEKLGRFNTLLGLSIGLHLLGILSNTYAIIDIPIPPRDAIFFGLVYTSIGFKLGGMRVKKISSYSTKLIAASVVFLLANVVENFVLMNSTGTSFIFQDYSLFTLPFAVSLFLLGLTNPEVGNNTRINLYGKYTLLGYIFHQIGGGILTGLTIGIGSLIDMQLLTNSIWNLGLTLLTYVLTMETVIYYRKNYSIKGFYDKITRLINR